MSLLKPPYHLIVYSLVNQMGVHESLKIPLDTYACNHGLAIYLAHFSLKYLKLRSRSSIITISPVIKGILPANLQILTKLCTDLPKGMN